MANELMQYVVALGIPVVVIALFALFMILIVGVILYFKRGVRVDSLQLIFREMVELARINREPHMISLYRLDMPPMSKYLETVRKMISRLEGKPQGKQSVEKTSLEHLTALQNTLVDYNARIGRNKRGIYKGSIIGFNRINIYTSFKELYQPQKNDKGGYFIRIDEKQYNISDDEMNNVKRTLDECGSFLNVIVYETNWGWKVPLLWRNTLTKAVLCFDDQLIGRDSEDGIITLLSAGTETHGFYFEIPSGYSEDRTKVILSFMQSLTWIRTLTQAQGNIFEVVNNALNMNPALLQSLTLKSAEKPVVQVREK